MTNVKGDNHTLKHLCYFFFFIVTEFLHIVKQVFAILATNAVDMHKIEICCLTFDCWMPRLLRGNFLDS